MNYYYGEIFALLTAFSFMITAMMFESAGRKVGSLPVNIIRLVIGLGMLMIFTWVSRGLVLPTDASMHNWIWLFLSGVIGLAFGDLFLFKAFVDIGSRVSLLIMSLVPPITAVIGFYLMGEILTSINILGMVVTIFGVVLVLVKRDKSIQNNGKKKIKLAHPIRGIIYALFGVIGQAVGFVMSKYGMGDYDAFASTQIRIIGGLFGFLLLFTIYNKWKRTYVALKNKNAMIQISIGSLFGPFLGVSFSLLAVQYVTTGVAATIMSIVPILISAPSIIFFKEKVTFREIVGSLIATAGIAILFLFK